MSISFVGTGNITLPNPILNDSQADNTAAKIRRTRGVATLPVYEGWTQTTNFTLTFRWLSTTDVSNLVTFLRANLGVAITYTDLYGAAHTAIILTPEIRFIHEGRDGSSTCGQHNTVIELEIVP